jgi:hypothetical protein
MGAERARLPRGRVVKAFMPRCKVMRQSGHRRITALLTAAQHHTGFWGE